MEHSAGVEHESLIAGEQLVVRTLGDAVVEDLVEYRGLERGDVEAERGLVDRRDRGLGVGVLGEAGEDSALDVEDFGERFSGGGKVSCRVQLACVML